jgi:DNA polymerase III delta prime subunit
VKTDTDELKIPPRSRPFVKARVDRVVSVVDSRGHFSGEHLLETIVGTQEVEVRFLEASGEFQVVEDDDVHELTRSDLKDLEAALRRFQENLPWDDSEAGLVLMGLTEAIAPTRLSSFTVRSVSDLGPVVLVAGKADEEDIDVVLELASGELTLIISKEDQGSTRRAPSTHEAHDLAMALRVEIEGLPSNQRTVLLAVVLHAALRIVLN